LGFNLPPQATKIGSTTYCKRLPSGYVDSREHPGWLWLAFIQFSGIHPVQRPLQQAFNQAGYEVDRISGAWDEETRQAALEFQQARGLEPTGNLTVSTARAAIGGLNVEMSPETGGPPVPGRDTGRDTSINP